MIKAVDFIYEVNCLFLFATVDLRDLQFEKLVIKNKYWRFSNSGLISLHIEQAQRMYRGHDV